MPFPKTAQGSLFLTAAVANGADATLPYPSGTSRADWAAADPATLQVALNRQNIFKGAAVTLKTVGTSLVITNNTGVAWAVGDRLTISAKARDLALTSMAQSNYDALASKDANTVYVTTSG